MTFANGHLNLLIARSPRCGWAAALPDRLASWPIDLHWSGSDAEAVDLAASGPMHLALVDDELPPAGGLDAVRRLRRLGLSIPCLYVCENPAPRVLTDAIKLDVFSVVQADQRADILPEMIAQVAYRVYRIELPGKSNWN